jgi:hypothetical protein
MPLETLNDDGVRFDVIVDLASGYGRQGILELKRSISLLSRRPDLMQTLPADATGQVRMELNRVN